MMDMMDSMATHECGGVVRAYSDGFRHCDGCGAFTFNPDAPFPTGTDWGAHRDAWNDDDYRSPDKRDDR